MDKEIVWAGLQDADDYMVKPSGVLELSARIRSLLAGPNRREGQGMCCSTRDIQVNPEDQGRRCQAAAGWKVELTLKEFELLVYLLENQSRGGDQG